MNLTFLNEETEITAIYLKHQYKLVCLDKINKKPLKFIPNNTSCFSIWAITIKQFAKAIFKMSMIRNYNATVYIYIYIVLLYKTKIALIVYFPLVKNSLDHHFPK